MPGTQKYNKIYYTNFNNAMNLILAESAKYENQTNQNCQKKVELIGETSNFIRKLKIDCSGMTQKQQFQWLKNYLNEKNCKELEFTEIETEIMKEIN